MIDQFMSIFFGEQVLPEESNPDLWSPIVNHDVEILDKEDRESRKAR